MIKQPHPAILITTVATLFLSASSAALARPGHWGGPMGGGYWPGGYQNRSVSSTLEARHRSDEGRIEVSRFVAEGMSAQLGHGPIAVASNSAGDEFTAISERAPFEAAVIDQLVHAGYDTTKPEPQAGQLAELHVTRTQIEPAERRRGPVSGETAVEVGNRGTAFGMAINVDLTKPLPPLVSTRLEARIRDRVTGDVLWEGRADVATREGDAHWTAQMVADKLAEALFDNFPKPG
ncbi:MAG: hypothetical protein ABIM50_08055 [Novosphingobium sp.]